MGVVSRMINYEINYVTHSNVYLDIIDYFIRTEEYDISIGMVYNDKLKYTVPINGIQLRQSSNYAHMLWGSIIRKHSGFDLKKIRDYYNKFTLQEL
jgi:hypothetical protein